MRLTSEMCQFPSKEMNGTLFPLAGQRETRAIVEGKLFCAPTTSLDQQTRSEQGCAL